MTHDNDNHTWEMAQRKGSQLPTDFIEQSGFNYNVFDTYNT